MCKEVVKGLLAGMGFPALFLPIAYTVLYWFETQTLREYPLQFVPLYIPLIFGLTNLVYLSIRDKCPALDRKWQLWIVGGCLGFLVALIGVFGLHIPELVLGLSHGFKYLPLIGVPIIYGLIFRYIVNWLNELVGLN